ncbi:MAG: hypothetical protein K940chlam1_00260 [Candidatus Anoxychlamydiales bacterium]|nr:hypothetical protein [Candidatus Anoxychlamydiales bacterium]NGX35854.1 hypothetical protein [Candidatus Anoxychlamydiales bacterium]
MTRISDVSYAVGRIFSPVRSFFSSKGRTSNSKEIATQTEDVKTEKDEIPSDLIDAITQEIIAVDPHTLICGHSYSKVTIAESLKHSTTCPQCRAEIKKEDVAPNEALAIKIQEYVNKNPLNKSYYEEEKKAILENYGHLADESIHPGGRVIRRTEYSHTVYPSDRRDPSHRPASSNTSQGPSTLSALRDMLVFPTDYMADLFFDQVSELPPGEPNSRQAELNRRVSIGNILPRYNKGEGIFRFKKYFLSLLSTNLIPSDQRAKTLYYSGLSGKIKQLTQTIALLSERIFGKYHQVTHSPKSIYANIKDQAKNGYFDNALRLVMNELKIEDEYWIDKSYSRIAKEVVADEVTDDNLKQVYRISEVIKDDKIRDKLFEKVAKACTQKREYIKASITISKMSNFFRKTLLFGFIWSLAGIQSFQLMIDVMLEPFRYLIKTFIED